MSTKEMSAKAEERLDRKSVDTCHTKIMVLLFIYEGKESPALSCRKEKKGRQPLFSVRRRGGGGFRFKDLLYLFLLHPLLYVKRGKEIIVRR